MTLDVNYDKFQKEWEKQESKIQKIIDEVQFSIKIDGVEGLEKIKQQLADISKLQKELNLTPYKAGKLAQMPAVAAAKETAKWNAKSALTEQQVRTEMERTAATAAMKEKRQLALNRAKMQGVSATNAQTNAYRSQAGVLNGLKQFMNSYISLLGGFRLLSNIKQITSEFELQRVSLRAITQDAEFADALFAHIKTTATESPFATKELVTYIKQLAAYRIENEHLYDTMTMLADVSAGLGVSMDRLILAYGQVKAASVLRGTELRQFTEAGIPLVDELAKKFSQLRGEVVTTGEVFDLISTRQVPFEMVSDIFKEMTAEGGRFYDMQRKQSETLYGVYENLKDSIQNSFDAIGRSQRGLLIGIGKLATVGARNFDLISSAITPLVVGMGAYRLATTMALKGTSGLAVSTNLLAKAEQRLNAITALRTKETGLLVGLMREARAANDRYTISILRAASATNVFSRAWYTLKAAIIANPFGAILTAVVSIYSALSAYSNRLGDVDRAQQRAAKTAEEYKESVESDFNLKGYDSLAKKLKEQENLLKSQKKSYKEFAKIYPELAEKYKTQEERLEALSRAEENRKNILEQIKSDYPEYFSYLDSENGKVADLTRGYADMTEAIRKSRLERLKSRAEELQEEISSVKEKLPKSYNRLSLENAKMLAPVATAKIQGLEAELSGITEEIEALEQASEDAAEAMVQWRKNYKELVMGGNMEDQALAALQFGDAVEDAQKKLKELNEEKAKLDKIPSTIIDESQVERLRKIKEDIPMIERFLTMYGQSLTDKPKSDNTALDALKSEYSLVQQIYKRYEDLRKLMTDPAAKRGIADTYGGLTRIDFLEPAALKARLEQLAKRAEALGDKDLALKIRLAIQDVDMSNIKDKLQDAINRISGQIKQQQDASNFFEKILGLSGDVELATSLTLGVTGVNVNTGNVGSLLSQQLATVLTQEPIAAAIPFDMQIEGTWNEKNIQAAIQSGQITIQQIQDTIANLTAMGKNDLAKTLQSALDSYVDYNKQLVEEMYATIDKFADAESKIESLKAQRDVKIDISNRASGVSDVDWSAYVEAVQRQTDEAIASIRFDELKKKFAEELSNLDVVSGSILEQIRGKFIGWLQSDEGSKASETDLKTMWELIEKIDNIQHQRNPLKYIIEAYEDLAKARKSGNADGEEKAWRKLKSTTKLAADSVADMASAIVSVIDTSLELAEALGISFSDDTLEMIEAFKDGFKLIAPIMTAVGVGMLFAADSALFLETVLWPLLLITIALASAFAIIKWISGADVRAANKEIEKQAKLLTELERSYKQLEDIQEDLAGSDWAQNQLLQIKNLRKQIDALNAQLEAEQSKGKKADEDAINDYKDSILDAQSEIRDSQRELISEMTGTSAVDTIKEFADAAVEAYLTFGDATDAMKESFRDMIKSMVANSLLAKVVQKRLEPVFDAIDEAYRDGEASGSELARVSDMMQAITETLPEELESILDGFEWLKDWRTPETGELTGIAKGVAQASEETVLTLAGYANSILYYQIWLKNDVAAIRAILEGRIAAVSPASTSEGGFNVGQLVSLQQQSLSQLQAINLNTGRSAESLTRLEEKLDSIISAPGATVRKVVNTRLSN